MIEKRQNIMYLITTLSLKQIFKDIKYTIFCNTVIVLNRQLYLNGELGAFIAQCVQYKTVLD